MIPAAVRSRSTERLVLAAVALLLALAVGVPSAWLRVQMRAQILGREGQTLAALVQMQRAIELERLGALNLGAGELDDFAVVLQTTRLAGVVAVRVFAAEGVPPLTFPGMVTDAALPPTAWSAVRARQPIGVFHAQFPLAALMGDAAEPTERSDLVEIVVPVGSDDDATARAAQYWVAGEPMAEELARLDRRLLVQALVVWTVAVVLAGGALGWAFRRLREAHSSLAARTEDLIRANEELKLAATSSALGAVAAHLVHGLKNPVAGLRGLARDHGDQTLEGAAAWLEAAAMADRLQSMVEEVTSLLRDERSGVKFAVSGDELRDLVARRTAAMTTRTGVAVTWTGAAVPTLDNRRAGLVALVLANLVQNACEASARGAGVTIEARPGGDTVTFAVADTAGGLPVAVRERLFLPVTTTKPGGSGIGLAISRQLIQHAGGTLELERSDASGTVFRITVPRNSR